MRSLNEECGVFGIWGHPEASNVTYFGLHSLQHRGQEGAGIVSKEGTKLRGHRDLGLVSEVFRDKEKLERLVGESAIGHVRYATSGSNSIQNIQPFLFHFYDMSVGICHNGNLINAKTLRKELEEQGITISEIQAEQASQISFAKVVIDAVFGIGLSRPVPIWLQQIFQQLNDSNSYIISVDMPSGLPTDRIPSPEEIWVHPHQLLTFQTPKLPFLLPSTGKYIPHWEVLDIGLDTHFLNTLQPDYYYLEPDILQLQRNIGCCGDGGNCRAALQAIRVRVRKSQDLATWPQKARESICPICPV